MPSVHFAPDACTYRGRPADFVADFTKALEEAEANGAAVVQQGVMPGGMKFAYVSAGAAGVPYLEIALIPAEIRAFFDYVKREAT